MAEFHNRNSARSRIDIPGFYNYSSQWYPCVLKDLSVDGAGLKMSQTFIAGDVIRLKIPFREEHRIVEATVANANVTRIGVRFSADLATQEFIRSIIQAYQRPTATRR